jgi:hypothetical protein
MTMTTDAFPPRVARGWAATLLDPERGSFRREALRFAIGVALASTYGLALGARDGLGAMLSHAAGVAITFAAVTLLGAPTLYVGWAHVGVDVEPLALASAVSRGSATAGLILAGLAPAMLLMGVTCERYESVAFYAAWGLVVSFGLGMRAIFRHLADAENMRGTRATLLSAGFVLFACVLAARVGWMTLPLIRSAS